MHDVGRIRREFGYDIWITAVITDAIMQRGPQVTYEAVRDFLTPEVKGTGRICLWAPGEAAGIPVASYEALYTAVRNLVAIADEDGGG